jgi:hypothetical protein
MVTKKSNGLKNKLIIYRVIVIGFLAFFLVQFDIVKNTNGKKGLGVYIFAVFVSLLLTMFLESAYRYIVKLAKK